MTSEECGDYEGYTEHEKLLLQCWKRKCDTLIAENESLRRQLQEEKERYTDAFGKFSRIIIERDELKAKVEICKSIHS